MTMDPELISDYEQGDPGGCESVLAVFCIALILVAIGLLVVAVTR